MDVNDVLAHYDREMRSEIEFPDMRRESRPGLVRFLRQPPGRSFILYSHLPAEHADAIIREQIEEFSRLDLPYSWDVYDHDQPPDLKQRLESAGFQEEDEPGTVMALDLAQAPYELLKPVSADVRPITSRDQLEDIVWIMEQVWEGDFKWMFDRMGSHLKIPGYLSIYAAYVDDKAACAGWTYFNPGSSFAALFGGSTVPHLRGRGLYTAVLAARVQEAIRRGLRFMVIDASAMSQPIVARHGFEVLTRSHSYVYASGT